MSSNIGNDKKEPPTIVKILIIASIVIGVLMTFHAFSETKKDNDIRTKRTQELKEEMSAVKFNCPYCKAYNSVKQKDMHGVVQCHNCKKWLTINSDGTVSVSEYLN